MQTTEPVKEEWNIDSLFVDCLPRMVKNRCKRNRCKKQTNFKNENIFRDHLTQNEQNEHSISGHIQKTKKKQTK